MITVATGTRRGDVLALGWKSVDLVDATVSVRQSLEQTKAGLRFKSTKNRKGRVLALPGFAVEALREHRAEQQRLGSELGEASADNGLVCCREDGAVWKPDSFTDAYVKFTKKMGVKVRFHDLRHTHAPQLLRVGVSPKVVSERIGLSGVGITPDVYSHILPGMQEESARKIDSALRAALEKQRRPLTWGQAGLQNVCRLAWTPLFNRRRKRRKSLKRWR